MSENKEKLKALYPFLTGEAKDPVRKNAALLNSVLSKASDSIDVKRSFFEENAAALIDTARSIAAVYENNGRLFIMGNGGSSCDAAHIAVEFTHPVTAGRPALTAVNLGADTAMLTAIVNDVGVSYIFSRQLAVQAGENDCLIGVSTSGNSENLIAAFHKAREMKLVTIGLAGTDGGRMAQAGFLDHCLIVNSDSIHRIQETHVAAYHILWDLTHTILADRRGNLGACEL